MPTMLRNSVIVLLVGILSCVSAQLRYLNEPQLLWNDRATEQTTGVRGGNGVFTSPDGAMVVSVAYDATVRAFNPRTGEILWTFTPPTTGFPIRSFGGITFNYRASPPMLVYAVADGVIDSPTGVDSSIATTRIIALDTSGNQLFQSTPLPGVAAGTPVTDFNGIHILVTHNEDRLRGYLSIFLLGNLETGVPLAPVFTEGYLQANVTEPVQRPFSPIGFFHNPTEGWYDGGEGNSNDIFIFGWDTPRTATSVGATDGQTFVFQFPRLYSNDGQGLEIIPIGSASDVHTVTPPILTNQGLSMYWAVSRGAQDCYVGVANLPRTKFSRGRSARVDTPFRRAERPFPAFQASRASPTLTRNSTQPTVYGVGPNTQLWSLDYQYSVNSLSVVDIEDIVSARVLLTGDERFVVYGTQALAGSSGVIAMREASRLARLSWSLSIPGGIQGDMTMDSRGIVVYAANTVGEIFAYQFAEDLSPTASPTSSPTLPESAAPSAPPSTAPPTTLSPTETPTITPTTATPTTTPTTSGPTATPTTESPTVSPAPTGFGDSDPPSDVPTGNPSDGSGITTGTPSAGTVTGSPVSGPETTGSPVDGAVTSSPVSPGPAPTTSAPVAAPVGPTSAGSACSISLSFWMVAAIGSIVMMW